MNEQRLRKEFSDAFPDQHKFFEGLCDEFFVSDEDLKQVRDLLDEGISTRLNPKTHHDSPLKFYPSFIETVPDRSEEGVVLAADIGGTRSRVLAVTIEHGDVTVDMISEDLPRSSHNWKGSKIFDFIADQLHRLLTQCKLLNTPEPIPMGFTFSFPVKKLALNSAILIQWTKNFNNDDIIGRDVVELLQEAIERKGNMNIKCHAIINDTIGTLISGAFKDRGCSVGLICGTGTNGCCFEPIDNVVDYKTQTNTSSPSVAIDTRWNNFGCDETIDFIRTEYDEIIRRTTSECVMGIEKLMSGMFIGEVVRQVLRRIRQNKILSTWPDKWNDTYSLSTETVSEILRNSDCENSDFGAALEGEKLTSSDKRIVNLVSQMVVVRAAYLTAACTACLVNRTCLARVGIAVDGSVYKHIQLFREVLDEKIRDHINPGTQYYFVPCEDGSGVGAALVAAMVSKSNRFSVGNGDKKNELQ